MTMMRVTEIMLMEGPVLTVQMDAPAVRRYIQTHSPQDYEYLELPIINPAGVHAVALILNNPRQVYLVMDTREVDMPDNPPQEGTLKTAPVATPSPCDIHVILEDDPTIKYIDIRKAVTNHE